MYTPLREAYPVVDHLWLSGKSYPWKDKGFSVHSSPQFASIKASDGFPLKGGKLLHVPPLIPELTAVAYHSSFPNPSFTLFFKGNVYQLKR